MPRRPLLLSSIAIAGIVVMTPVRASAQAFTPPAGVGSVTFAWQFVNNTGHRLSDGAYRERGQSVTTSLLAELEYGVTDRLTFTLGAPYIGAKYTGSLPAPSGLAIDTCKCWQSSFQDVGTSVRYRFGTSDWAFTPLVRVDLPTGYAYKGEAVVGKNLREILVGAGAALRFGSAAPKLSVQGLYTYALVEKPLDDVSVNRSNGAIDLGIAASRKLFVRGTVGMQYTHGGLRFGSPTGTPFFPPGELDTPERYSQRDRLLKVKYVQVGAGAAYSVGAFDVFGSFAKYLWGRDAHNGWIYNAGVTFYFDVGRGTALFNMQPGSLPLTAPGRVH